MRGSEPGRIAAGFDLEHKRERDALVRMGPGWREVVLPRLAEVAAAPQAWS